MIRKILLVLFAAMAAACAWAKPIDDAKSLYFAGKHEQAIEKLKAILKSSPKDGTANYYLGLCYFDTDRRAEARKPLLQAESRGIADASRRLAEICMGEYDMDGAAEHVSAWERQLRKDKKEVPDEVGVMRNSIVQMRNMLDRVENIEIVDTIVVDEDEFFTRYMLSPGTGRLADASVLPAGISAEPVYIPQTGSEMFFGMPSDSDDGVTRLASITVLDDGRMEPPALMSNVLNEGGNADYPFFASDGTTFYFANDGENSIGGYDIYMSRRNPDGSVFQPQNIGMPYNSPFNDYMLVLDDESGYGWWASDREQIPGMVTIYVFKINDTRLTHDSGDPRLAEYAMARNVGQRQPLRVDQGPAEPDAEEFILALGNGMTYTRLADFANKQAAQAMRQYLDRSAELQKMEDQAEMLRSRYAQGDRSLAEAIEQLEQRIDAARPALQRLRNQAVTLELKNRR